MGIYRPEVAKLVQSIYDRTGLAQTRKIENRSILFGPSPPDGVDFSFCETSGAEGSPSDKKMGIGICPFFCF